MDKHEKSKKFQQELQEFLKERGVENCVALFETMHDGTLHNGFVHTLEDQLHALKFAGDKLGKLLLALSNQGGYSQNFAQFCACVYALSFLDVVVDSDKDDKHLSDMVANIIDSIQEVTALLDKRRELMEKKETNER